MKKAKTIIAKILLFSLLVMSIAGCAQESSSGDEPSSDGKLSGKVTIWNYDVDYYAKLIEYFNDIYPDVEIESVPVDGGEYTKKWFTAYAAKTDLPDIAILEETIFSRMSNIEGAWEDLEQPPYNLDRKDISPICIPLSINDKDVYMAVNESITASGMAYRRDLAEKYLGVSEPDEVYAHLQTWDDYIELAKTIRDKSGGTDYLFTSIFDIQIVYFNQMVTSVCDKDGNINRDVLTEQFTMLKKFEDAGGYDPQIPGHWETVWFSTVSDGNHMMIPCAPWMIRYVIKPNDENGTGNWGIIDPPEKPYAWGGTGFPISSTSKNKWATFKFLQEIYLSEEGGKFYKTITSGEIIPYEPYAQSLELISNVDPFFAGQDVGKKIVQWVNDGAVLKPTSKYEEVSRECIEMAMGEMLKRDISVEELVEFTVNELNNIIPIIE